MIRLRTKITVDVSFYAKPDGTVAGLAAPSDLEAAALGALATGDPAARAKLYAEHTASRFAAGEVRVWVPKGAFSREHLLVFRKIVKIGKRDVTLLRPSDGATEKFSLRSGRPSAGNLWIHDEDLALLRAEKPT